jgi:hypothetical protein
LKVGGSPLTRISELFTLVLVLSLVAVILVSAIVTPVNGFELLDHALCKEIDRTARNCKQRTSEFLATDEWAYLWFKGSFDTSDVGAKYEMKIYDPDGNLFAPRPGFAVKDGVFSFRRDYSACPYCVMEPGQVVGWMGISITTNTALFYVNSTAISVSYSFFVPNAGVPPLKLGQWRSEFTLNDKVIVSERLLIGKTPATTTTPGAATTVTAPTLVRTETQPGLLGLPSNITLIGGVAAVAVIAIVVGGYMYLRRKKRTSNV